MTPLWAERGTIRWSAVAATTCFHVHECLEWQPDGRRTAGHGGLWARLLARHLTAFRSTWPSTQQTVIPGVLNLTLSDPQGLSSVMGSSYDDTIIGNAQQRHLDRRRRLERDRRRGTATTSSKGASRGSSTSTSPPYELPGQHVYTPGRARRDPGPDRGRLRRFRVHVHADAARIRPVH